MRASRRRPSCAAADVLEEIRHAGEFGIIVGSPTVDFEAVSARRDKVVSTLTGGVSGLMKKNGVEVHEGVGTLAGGGAVTVGGEQLSARTIVLATGSVKRPIPGTSFGGRVIGTEEAWALSELPRTWPSSAPEPRARRSPPPTRGSASR